jgi:hypothetical protein
MDTVIIMVIVAVVAIDPTAGRNLHLHSHNQLMPASLNTRNQSML